MPESNKKPKYTVRFLPDDIEVKAREGENLLRTAVEHGIHIDANCGGAGVCGKCVVQVEGKTLSHPARKRMEDLPEGHVLACRTDIMGDVTVTLSAATRVQGTLPSRSGDAKGRVRLSGLDIDNLLEGRPLQPIMTKVHLQLPAATQDSNLTDRLRLYQELKAKVDIVDHSMDFELLKELPSKIRQSEGDITATVIVDRPELFSTCLPSIVAVEDGDTTDAFYALAFDIGTTSVWAQWIDLKSGEVLAQAADYNDQIRYGADVINRILACRKREGLPMVQKAVIDTMNRLIEKMTESNGLLPGQVSYMVIAGNTTMSQILYGIDPTYIQLSPHTPTTRYYPPVRASDLGLNLPPHVLLLGVPSVSAWVGGDIVAGVLASKIAAQEKMTLFIDMGTNGEIVLGNQEFLLTASCSAGPAFEGGDIEFGMRAMDGAIEDFHLNAPDAEPMVLTIGQQPALGICGSGLINIIAGLFLAGVLQPDGKFIEASRCPRLKTGENGTEYVLVYAEASGVGKDITINEMDVDNLLRAKSAIYAGIRTLVMESGFDMSMIEQVLIAGSFGQSIDIEKAITIGLMPDLPPENYFFIGNGSLLGARLTVQCADCMAEGNDIASKMTYIDLGTNSRFMDEYTAGNFLPHTNRENFPSVFALIDKNGKNSP